MSLIVNILIKYIKTKATTELIKTIAFSLLRALAERSDAKTDDSVVDLIESIEGGSVEAVEQSVSDLVNSIGLDLNRVSEKNKK